jgi:hypothetical protein
MDNDIWYRDGRNYAYRNMLKIISSLLCMKKRNEEESADNYHFDIL